MAALVRHFGWRGESFQDHMSAAGQLPREKSKAQIRDAGSSGRDRTRGQVVSKVIGAQEETTIPWWWMMETKGLLEKV